MSSKEKSNDFPIFLSRSDLQPYTGLSTKTCLRILTERGVKPVDVGDRRGALKWHRDAVKQVLDAMHEEAQNTKAAPRSRHHRIIGKSAAEVMAEIERSA